VSTREAKEDQDRALGGVVVAWVVALRREYLASPQANQLAHWDRLQTRMRGSARTAAGAAEWITDVRRRMVPGKAPSRDSARCSEALLSEVRDQRLSGSAFLEWIEHHVGSVLAEAMVQVDEAKEAKNARSNEV
jgi:hypothetical protein